MPFRFKDGVKTRPRHVLLMRPNLIQNKTRDEKSRNHEKNLKNCVENFRNADFPADLLTDKASYRDTRMHLKIMKTSRNDQKETITTRYFFLIGRKKIWK